jgi:phospholipid transport system substrate-binding protein
MTQSSTRLPFGIQTLRSFILVSVLVLGTALNAAAAFAGDQAAEQFAQNLIDRGLGILRDNSGGDVARKSRFHDFVVQNVDAQKTALFTLGQYRRGASAEAVEPFVNAFREYATAVYEARLEERKALPLKVVGSVENKPGDVTVNTEAKDPNASEPARIALRLLGSSGSYKVVDVQAAGIWLSIEQRDQFATFLSKHNGDIKALTADLIEQTKRIRSGGRSPDTN